MAFRDVRTAAALTVVLLLSIGCEGPGERTGGTEAYDGLPHDTVALSADDLARLPWYGVQRLPCDTVDRYLVEAGVDTATTGTVELRLDADSLVADPHLGVAGLGDTIRIRSDSLVWVVHFKEMSPFTGGTLTVPGQVTMPAVSREQAASAGSRLVVADDESTCGRYYYSIAAYHPDRADRIYVADPPMWIRY